MISRLGLAILVLSCLSACGKDDAATPGAPRVAVSTVILQQGEMPVLFSVPGSVVSDDRIDLSSRVVGFIQHIDVREGHRVAKGDRLVQIDPADINEAIRQNQAGVAAARNDLEDAERDVEKYSKLAAGGYAPTETLRKAKVRGEIARSSLAKAQAALASANAQRSYSSILSPVDGVVVARYRNPGEMATTGQPILTLESRQNLVLRAFVPEMQVTRIGQGMAVGVRVDALPGQTLSGSVTRIVPSGDPTTRRYQVDILLPPGQPLLPGMFGRAEFPLGQSPALLVPRAALVRRGGLDGVFVVDPANMARFRWLRLGREWQGQVEVVDGLSAGERIVTQADATVRDGVIIEAAGHG
jgi:RND family efflux transporter MFP subunit